MTAADLVATGLRRAGVARVFVADGASEPLVAALHAAALAVVATTRPASACVMAAVTGRLGAAPGVALIGADEPAVRGALGAALRERAPAIVVSSGPPADVTVIKTTVVLGADSAAHWIAHAAQAAMAEPPGCVWLEVGADIAPRAALPVATATRPAALAVDTTHVDAVAQRLAAAARPVIVAGRECRAAGAASWLRALAESLPAPVLVTPAARGALPDPHPLCFGALRADAPILGRADVILALGVDEQDLADAAVIFAGPVLRLGRTLPWDEARGVPVAEAAGDVATLLEELPLRLRARARADWDVAELDRIRRARPAPDVDAAVATLVTRVREATPAGTAAVFAREVAFASPLWDAVTAGEVLVEDRVVAAAAAVALERPEALVLAFVRPHDDLGADVAEATGAGVRVLTPRAGQVGAALDAALEIQAPRIVIVTLAG